ncbi:hypothetical protein SprV_0501924400 [Sparganum proliferum]
MQDAWTTRKAEDIEEYEDRNEGKNFFAATKAVYGPIVKGTAPLLRADEITLLTGKTQILKRWAEHFHRLLTDGLSEVSRRPEPKRYRRISASFEFRL